MNKDLVLKHDPMQGKATILYHGIELAVITGPMALTVAGSFIRAVENGNSQKALERAMDYIMTGE